MINQILELLQGAPLTQTSICRRLNNKTTWCNCKYFQNASKRNPDSYCDIKPTKVKSVLTKLMIKGKIMAVRCRVKDQGQPRKWDLMTTYYLWDQSILDNFEQVHIQQPRQTKLVVKDKDCNHCKSQGKCAYEKDVDNKIPYTGNCPMKICLLKEPWLNY